MNDLYYIINTKHIKDEIIDIAKFCEDTGHFYDYNSIYYIDENVKYELGMVFRRYEPPYSITGEVHDAVMREIKKMQEAEIEKKKNRPDVWPNPEVIPTTEEIIDTYFNNKVQNGEQIDSYIVDIIRLIANPMGLRLREWHGESYYKQLGLDYREDIEDIIGAMYKIISDHFMKSDDAISFGLCVAGVKTHEYALFLHQIGLLTGYPTANISSDLEYRLRSLEYCFPANDSYMYRELIMQRPFVTIAKDKAIYQEDCMNPEAKVSEVTPQKDRTYSLPRKRHL